MAYDKQNWVDYPDETTPISADRLSHIEDGIEDAADNADEAISNGLKDVDLSIVNDVYTIVDNAYALMYMNITGHKLDGSNFTSTSRRDVATLDSLRQLKSVIDSQLFVMQNTNSMKLSALHQVSSIDICYYDGEHTKHSYTFGSEILPIRFYQINDSSNLPSGITPTDVPTVLRTYCGYDVLNRYLQSDTSVAFIDSISNYTVVDSWVTGTSGDILLVALTYYGSSYYAVVVGLNATTHTITQTNVGIRYAQDYYVYYPMVLVYGNVQPISNLIDDENKSLNTTYSSEKIVADVFGDTTWSTVSSVIIESGSRIPVPFYSTNLGETWESYTAYSGDEGAIIFYPWNNSDIPMAITLTYMDGTEVVGQVLDKADLTTYDLSYGYATNLTNFTYYHIDNDIALVLIVTGSSMYMYLVNTTTHTVLGTHGLLSTSTSQGEYIQSVQIYSQRCGLINDNITNTTNTYSSAKIRQVIGESFSDIMEELYKIKYKKVVVDGGTLGNLEIINHETTQGTYVAYAPDTTVISGQPNRYVKATLDSGFDLDKVQSVTVTNTSTGFDVTIVSPFDSLENIFASHAPDGTDLGFDWQVCGDNFSAETVEYLVFAQRGTDLFISYIEEDPQTFEYYLSLTGSNLLSVGDDLSGFTVAFVVNRFDD